MYQLYIIQTRFLRNWGIPSRGQRAAFFFLTTIITDKFQWGNGDRIEAVSYHTWDPKVKEIYVTNVEKGCQALPM